MTKVSAIIPVYNSEQYLDKCIQSILNQTLKEFELIIINDGSTDNSHEIILKYEDDERVKYFKRKNHGIGNTRNFGIDKATSEYICFIDSDDFIHESMFENMYNRCVNDNLDFLVCDYYHYLENSQSIQRFDIPSFENTTLNESPNLLLDINMGPCNKFIKRELFDDKNMRFPENIKYEDMPLVVKLLDKSDLIGKINEPLCYFMVHDNSETTTMDERIFDIFKVLHSVNGILKDNEYVSEYLEWLNVKKLTTYTVQQRYQKDKILREKFIDDAFDFLNKNFPNWKKSKHFKNKNIFKSIIEKNKKITKIYCSLYNLIKK
ncbi:MAG: glycosyltransferase family 2 protein [Bacilli bacterium]|nr:glycosyltransferase family 2 protein [Bacilli bacterium]